MKPELKLYICDRGWAGCDVVIEESLEEAQKHFMSLGYRDGRHSDVIELPITKGSSFQNVGDT